MPQPLWGKSHCSVSNTSRSMNTSTPADLMLFDGLITTLDPKYPEANNLAVVVIGHSMGGLLTRTLVTDSGDAIWNSTFAIPFSEIAPGVEQLPQLRRLFYFQPKPYVK